MIQHIITGKHLTVVLTEFVEDNQPAIVRFDLEASEGIQEDLQNMTEQEFVDKWSMDEKLKEQIAQNNLVVKLKNHPLLVYNEEFETFYMKGYESVSIPPKFAEFLQNYEGDFRPLELFWVRCLRNPNPQARENLFDFLKLCGFNIAPNGMFVGYRKVEEVGFELKGTVIDGFMSTLYRLRKQVKDHKKSPKKMFVHEVKDESGRVVDYKATKHSVGSMGSVQELIDLIPECGRFTDGRTHTMDIRLTSPVEMNRADCDESLASCSTGLHVATRKYSFSGHFRIAVLVDPTDVVSVPSSYEGKLRSCRYYPVKIVETRDEDIFSTEVSDTEVAEFVSNLQEAPVNTNFDDFTPEEVISFRYAPNDIKLSLFKKAVIDIEEHKNTTSSRVVVL